MIALSGGSTIFKDLGRRIQRDVKRSVDARIKMASEISKAVKVFSITLIYVNDSFTSLSRLMLTLFRIKLNDLLCGLAEVCLLLV